MSLRTDLTSTPFRSPPHPTWVHSPYGFVSWVTDYNKQGYLQRTDKVCDFAMTSAYSKCDAVSHCFGNYTTLYDFDICMESNVHGNLHSMHAGLFDCEVSWKTWYEENTWISKNRLSFFAVQVTHAPLPHRTKHLLTWRRRYDRSCAHSDQTGRFPTRHIPSTRNFDADMSPLASLTFHH